MNPQEPNNWKRKLQELEQEVQQTSSKNPAGTSPSGTPFIEKKNLNQSLNQIRDWFNTLPSAGKVVVVIMTAIIGFSLLNTVLRLVSSLLTIAILAVVLYLLYKFFIAPQSSQ